MVTTMKHVPLTDVPDISEMCQMSVVLDMKSAVWIICCYYGTVYIGAPLVTVNRDLVDLWVGHVGQTLEVGIRSQALYSYI